MHWLYIMSSKKKPIIKDLAAFTYNMFKIHDDFVNFCHSAHICSTIYCNRTWARGLIWINAYHIISYHIVLEHSRWSLIDRLDDVYRDISDIVYLLDVLVVVVHISHSNCWEYLLLHQDWGECSEGWAGAWGWKFLETEILLAKTSSWGLKTPKKMGGGGRFWNACTKLGGGCLGRPTPPTGGRAGSENDTLLPMTCLNYVTVWLGGQKLSSGNLGGGRIKKILTKP